MTSGINACITLASVILEMANECCDGVAGHMDVDLEFGNTAQCDDNERVSIGNGHVPGHSHVLDIDNRHLGEPHFNGCK